MTRLIHRLAEAEDLVIDEAEQFAIAEKPWRQKSSRLSADERRVVTQNRQLVELLAHWEGRAPSPSEC